MNNRRLWPVASVLAVLLMGSASVELLAKYREPQTRSIVISRGQEVVDADDVELTQELLGAPINAEHERARQLQRRGDLDQALTLLEQLSTRHPEHESLRAEQAHALLRTDRPDAALSLLDSLSPTFARRSEILFERGLCLERLGRNGKAEQTLREALQGDPHHTGIRLALGHLLRHVGRVDAAISILAPAARSGSNDERARALVSLGRCYLEAGQRRKADSAFEEAVQRAPSSVGTWTRVARALLHSKQKADHELATSYAKSAAQLAPQSPVVQKILGKAFEQTGQVGQAVAAYREAVRLDPGYRYPRKRLLRLALDAEDYRLARRQADALLRIDPDRADHQFLAGLVESRAGNLDAARRHYQRSNALSKGGNPEAFFNLGLLEREAGHEAEAIMAYEQAIALRKNYRAAYNNLGLVHMDRRDYERAEASFREAIGIDAGYAAAWTNLAKCLSAEQHLEDAISAYRRALELSPNSRSSVVGLAIALRKAGRAQQAVLLYEELLHKDSRYVTGWYNLGVALDSVGRKEAARDAYERALSLDPHHLKALKNLGLLEKALGQRERARAHMTDALDRDPTDSELRLELATLMLAERDIAGCSHAARLVLAQTPDNASAKALLSNCQR